MEFWSWVLPGVSLVAMRLAGRNNKFGWLLGAVNQGAWAICGIIFQQWGYLAWGLFYIVTYLLNLYDWHRRERGMWAQLGGPLESARATGCVCTWITGFGVGDQPEVWQEEILYLEPECPVRHEEQGS